MPPLRKLTSSDDYGTNGNVLGPNLTGIAGELGMVVDGITYLRQLLIYQFRKH